jgi:hypothetical protein
MPRTTPYKLNDDASPIGPFITTSELSQRSGLLGDTIRKLSRNGVIPRAVRRDEKKRLLFDLGDRKLANWLAAITSDPK